MEPAAPAGAGKIGEPESWAVVLAGGRSRRMGGGPPKPLRRVAGRTLLQHVAASLEGAGIAPGNEVIVVSPGFDRGASGLAERGCLWAVQSEARGTADAARCGLEAIPEGSDPRVIIALADVPFTRPATYAALARTAPPGGIAFVTAELPDPGALGRVVRDAQGRVEAVVEFKELAPGQGALREINAGHFCGSRSVLLGLIGRIEPGPRGGELYLTEAVRLARLGGRPVEAVRVAHVSEALGANTPEELEALAAAAGKEGQ